MQNVVVSIGSVCTASFIKPHNVLGSLGLSENEAFSVIWFSLGRFNTHSKVKAVVKMFNVLLQASIKNA